MDPAVDSRQAITPEALHSRLRTRRLAQSVEFYESIDSTNRRALELASSGAPDGTLVLTEHQTRGRGRLTRIWHAPPHSSLLLSLILRPPLAPHQAQRATMLCAIAAVEAIAETTGLAAGIKWPNDILIGDRKAGGILTELQAQGNQLIAIVVGIGLNVNLDAAELPEVMTPATSLAGELGRSVERLPLLVDLLQRADALYARMLGGWSPVALWRQHLVTLGQSVRIATDQGVLEGTATDVDADGALLVTRPSGQVQRILVGDVVGRAVPPAETP